MTDRTDKLFLHPDSRCESSHVGAGTRIWAFAHILPEAVVGEDCNICDHTFIENDVVIGNRVTIKSGVQLWDGIRLEDDVFVGPNATFTNDPFPRSRIQVTEYPRTVVRQGASIGANAVLLPGIEVGRDAMVGAGAVVTRSVPPHAIVAGNPARIRGYVEAGLAGDGNKPTDRSVPATEFEESKVKGVTPLSIGSYQDLRGKLAVAEYPSDLPFRPNRFFFVYDVPSAHVRGEHAHHQCDQVLICVHGSLRVMVDDGVNRQEFTLDSPARGLWVAPMVWAAQYHFSTDAVLAVLASHAYDNEDYIRNYNDWLQLAKKR